MAMSFFESGTTDGSPSALVTASSRGRSRSDTLTALILGFFSAAWFGWGQAEASHTLSTALTIGSCAALLVVVLGALRLRRAEGAAPDRSVGRRYGIIVGIEFTLAGLGAGVLGASGAPAYIPVWVCAVVGVHFFALAALFQTPALRWLGGILSAVAVAALLVGATTDVSPGSVTGPGAGIALLTYATLMLAHRAQPR
jgi:hypothetical protein